MFFILGLIITGLVVGALGRFAIPGPNPMSIGMTIVVGIGGALLGGIVGRLIFGTDGGGLLLAVAGAALIVWLMERSRARGAA
ncbi:MAG: GlsB/YeaQ/YmgE family stress response membrane protein [Actinomycetota bacterium]|nr:GlsB/YeaQ/YmgE family stress response membrane protein [Actinomycetota bacterium]